jgi:hypothetical protein
MGTSASPPDDSNTPVGAEEEEDLELTSIMDAEQRRALQKAARTGKAAEETKEAERPTARPPPQAVAAVLEEEVAIPKAPLVPSELPARAANASATAPTVEPPTITTWQLVAFVMLAAAVAYALR